MNKKLPFSGILLVNKNSSTPSFHLVKILRKITNVSKIGFSGTLDPLAKGLMIMLIGKAYTRRSDEFTNLKKEYRTTICCGKSTTTFDREGETLFTSSKVPTLEEVKKAIDLFQGETKQIPPMFSAKKIKGTRLYKLARKGVVIERSPITVTLKTTLISYCYPSITLHIQCSKGTYIRSIAHDLGEHLNCGAHLSSLTREKIGSFHIDDAIDQDMLTSSFEIETFLKKL